MPIIKADHVVKEFMLGQRYSLRDTLSGIRARLKGQQTDTGRKVFRALDNVSFEIEEGEVVGLIGTNGAGKSTLLKILSRITQPTNGSVHVGGRVAPLIEVGAGLHPELTGRENIYLNASILGVPRKTIHRKVDEIGEFAELQKFLDTPIKRYSSGMKVRLGFAIATSVDAEILIVDEVLAVGDLAFQRKCFDRMEELIRAEGRTVLLVSHNIRQIHRMCSRTLLLDQGRLIADGSPEEICNLFYEQSNERIASQQSNTSSTHSDGTVSLDSISILDPEGKPTHMVTSGNALRIRVAFTTREEIKGAEIVIGTHTPDFVYLTAHTTLSEGSLLNIPAGRSTVELEMPSFPVRPGSYALRLCIFGASGQEVFRAENLYRFLVTNADDQEHKRPPLRLIDLPAEWRLDNAMEPQDHSIRIPLDVGSAP